MLFHIFPLICYVANMQSEKQLTSFEKGGVIFHDKGLQKG